MQATVVQMKDQKLNSDTELGKKRLDSDLVS